MRRSHSRNGGRDGRRTARSVGRNCRLFTVYSRRMIIRRNRRLSRSFRGRTGAARGQGDSSTNDFLVTTDKLIRTPGIRSIIRRNRGTDSRGRNRDIRRYRRRRGSRCGTVTSSMARLTTSTTFTT